MLEKIISQLLQQSNLTTKKIDEIKRRIASGDNQATPATSRILRVYRELVQSKKIQPSPELESLLKKRAVRTLSGVAIITVLTKPWPCPGQCVYCPLEKDMPKSYLKNEPAAQRAYFNKFDPYNQVISRLETLYQNGHPTDKIELIVKGGSWNAYLWNYQVWFIKECFRACNGFKDKIKNTKLDKEIKEQELQTEQTKNETAVTRIVGLTLETRPDLINPESIKQMRQLGCTRIELGVQHTDNKILKLIKRGHTLEQTKQAIRLLRGAGFKIDFHLMPQLPGATPQKDYRMIKEIFTNPDLRPDMIKIYPCAVIKNSELYSWFQEGKYKPYSDEQLLELLIKVKSKLIPRYCRISRLIRDIPSTDIIAGNKVTNLREVVQKEMAKQGLKCPCLRCREIGHQKITPALAALAPKLFIDKYEASGGQEYFLSFEDATRNIVFAFCRLRIDPQGLFPAFIRELHTYGHLVPVGQNQAGASQHKGWGKKLVSESEKIAQKNKIKKIAVISGIGVRDYYRQLGYKLEDTYMVKKLKWKI